MTATRARTLIAAAALVAAAAILRTRAIDAGYWIDEGLSVGIAGHPLGDIPGLLRNDGSPPLYYLLLHVWTGVAGDGEVATRVLSLIAALAAIPAALHAGTRLFGARAGWAAAAIAATAPLLTAYAQETRMYALLALLSILACSSFVRAFLHGERRWVAAFAALSVLLLYTHNWGLYLLIGLACALPFAARVRGARPVARDAAIAAAVIGLAYLPWLPTLLHQAASTGAPWSSTPGVDELAEPLTVPLGEGTAALVVLLAAAFGLARLTPARRVTVAALGTALVAGALVAWLGAQVEPGWAGRYMNAFTGPVVLVSAAGIAAAGRAGLAALAAALILWAVAGTPDTKSNVRDVAGAAKNSVNEGDVVVVAQPEQVAVVSHYMSEPRLVWATTLGPTSDPSVFDWHDAVGRLDATPARATLDRLLVANPRARRLVLVYPVAIGTRTPRAPWLAAVDRATQAWIASAGSDPRLTRERAYPAVRPEPDHRTDVQAIVYRIRVP
jgi:hypothetical protein